MLPVVRKIAGWPKPLIRYNALLAIVIRILRLPSIAPGWLYLFCIIKGSILILLDQEFMSSFHWLDCYLPGRFQFGSRIPKVSKYVFVYVFIHLYVARYYAQSRGKKCNLSFLDFISFSHEQVARWSLLGPEKHHSSVAKLTNHLGNEEFCHRISPLTSSSSSSSSSNKTRPPKKSSDINQVSSLANKTAAASDGGETRRAKHEQQDQEERNARGRFMDLRYFRDPFEPNGQLIARPHRDTKTWGRLRTITSLLMAFWVLNFIFCVLGNFVLILPAFVTRRGFEHVYKSCSDFINQLERGEAKSYEHIYVARGGQARTGGALVGGQSRAATTKTSTMQADEDDFLPLMLPFVDFQPVSLYQVARVLIDVTENLVCSLDIVSNYLLQFNVLLLITSDVSNYGDCIIEKLVYLNNAFRRRNYLEKCCKVQSGGGGGGGGDPVKSADGQIWTCGGSRCNIGNAYNHRAAANHDDYTSVLIFCNDTGACQARRQCQIQANQQSPLQAYPRIYYEQQVTEVQALIQDYFKTVVNYGVRVNMIIITSLVILYVHITVIYLFWLNGTKISAALAQQASFEMIGLSLSATLFTTTLLALGAKVASKSNRIYTVMATAMALDSGVYTTKLRWIQLVRFYQPKQLHCFKLLDHEPVTWLFILKIFSWTCSAFVVIKSWSI